MAEHGHCAVCGKRTRARTLDRHGGLCWNCAHPGFWLMTLLIAAAIGTVVLVVVLKCCGAR